MKVVVVVNVILYCKTSPASLVFSSFSPSLTTSEDEADEAELKRVAARARWGRLGAVKEDRSSQEEDEEDGEDKSLGGKKWLKEDEVTRNENNGKQRENGVRDDGKINGTHHHKEPENYNKDDQIKRGSEGGKMRIGIDIGGVKGRLKNSGGGILRLGSGDSDVGTSDEEGPWRYKEFGKDYEPLKSVQLLRNMEKSLLSTYLPAHTLASDTETGEP
ncbi:hypothetical protein Pcinc_019997 [Petrolisthes cinctipes]|uniref:Uncharacterized protein n=1 Tax=Petrolisthes cinctipes TaxID=88211 RepID=A0AAE1FJY3_PETCI|nr:hypothetical protein Pcinc_019997 [Petrolisthes cinctipes]